MSTLTMFVHGEAGVGKSTLGATSPGPRLILDAEGRAKYLPYAVGVREWDPINEHPPQYDGTWDTCIAIVPDFRTFQVVYQWLQSGQHPFVSVVVDSLMEIQKRLIDVVAGVEQLDQQDWGRVYRELEKLCREYRDLVLSPHNPTQVVVLTCGSREGKDGKMRPLLSGQMSTAVPYLMDIVGYMYTDFSFETNEVSRHMLVQPTPKAVAKEGTQTIRTPTIANPRLDTIYAALNGSGNPAAEPVASVQTNEGGADQ